MNKKIEFKIIAAAEAKRSSKLSKRRKVNNLIEAASQQGEYSAIYPGELPKDLCDDLRHLGYCVHIFKNETGITWN